jgi:hypothetical protein
MFAALVIGAAMLAQTEPARYVVHRVDQLPAVTDAWDAPAWAAADMLTIERFHPRGSDHHPRTQARVLHDGRAIAVMFRVEDRYMLARNTEYQSPTHKDSCVEFFVRPRADRGYFNFEFNAIGTLLLWYVEKPRGPDGVFGKYTEVAKDVADAIAVSSSIHEAIADEDPKPRVWTISYRIPLALFERYTGALGSLSGQTWRANFYKCADDSSHPHWGYWADVGERLDFHQPDRFAEIVFE